MIFVDTGALVGRYLARDQHHAAAERGWAELARRGWRCVTTNLVVSETVTLLARWAGAGFAAERARSLLTSERLTVFRPTVEDELQALELLEKFADQPVSFTDCISFVAMRARGLDRAFSFDRHFQMAGFRLWPPAAGRAQKRRGTD